MNGRAASGLARSGAGILFPVALATLAAGHLSPASAVPRAGAPAIVIAQNTNTQSATSETGTASRTLSRRTSAGQPVEIGHWANLSRGFQGHRYSGAPCQSRSEPRIDVIEQPRGGTINVRSASFVWNVPASSAWAFCNGRTVSGVEVVYSPRPDFRGADTGRYQVRFGHGAMRSVTATIIVE